MMYILYINAYIVFICSATALGFPFLPPYLKVGTLPLSRREYGVNFAVAGATALDPLVLAERLTLTQTSLSLDVQIGWFQQLRMTTCTTDPGNDLTKYKYRMLYVS